MADFVECYAIQSCYLQQVGQSEPEYIAASPSAPVLVRLPASFVRRRVDKDSGDVTEEVVKLKLGSHLKLADKGVPKEPKKVGPPGVKTAAQPAHKAVKLEKPE